VKAFSTEGEGREHRPHHVDPAAHEVLPNWVIGALVGLGKVGLYGHPPVDVPLEDGGRFGDDAFRRFVGAGVGRFPRT
jgi:hypothetical protein